MIQAESFAAINAVPSVKIAASYSSNKIVPRQLVQAYNRVGKLFHGLVGTLQELTDDCEHLEKR